MESIRAAEEKADEIRKAAAEQAREMVKAAEEAALEESRQAFGEIRAEYQQKLKQHEAAVAARIQTQTNQKQQQLEAYRQSAVARLNQASALIVERVLQHGDR